MTGDKSLRNPELDRLVAELNEGGEESDGGSGPLSLEGLDSQEADSTPSGSIRLPPSRVGSRVRPGTRLHEALVLMVENGASDLLLLADTPWALRVDGRLARAETHHSDEAELLGMFGPFLDRHRRKTLEERGSADLTLRMDAALTDRGSTGAWRFRVNLHRQRGQIAVAIRALPQSIPTLESLNLPSSLRQLVQPSQGLVLFCGPTGSGKSSTLAALLGEINRTQPRHVITIEDPVEYEHVHDQSLIEHIQIGSDAPSYPEALRAALRQDPDVILVGEMRDLETISTALTAAETGHLILSTVHTNDVAQAIHRMVDSFPTNGQSQIRQQLALSLSALVGQRLVPRSDGQGRLPALEILLATYPVRQHIRSDQVHKLYNEIHLGQRQGMRSMEHSLAEYVARGLLEPDEARARCNRPDELESLLGS